MCVAPQAPKGDSRTKSGRFYPSKVDFSRRKSAVKFLSVHEWLVGDIPFHLKFSDRFFVPNLNSNLR